jgi:hypothetical protein
MHSYATQFVYNSHIKVLLETHYTAFVWKATTGPLFYFNSWLGWENDSEKRAHTRLDAVSPYISTATLRCKVDSVRGHG